MPLPSIGEFTAAIQRPDICFVDPELIGGSVALHPSRGTPLVYSGNFAAVYPVAVAGGRKYAVRCFTREVKDQRERYGYLDNYLRHTLPPTLVEFEFHEKGIMVRGEWYPIVKMEWVNGEPLNKHVRDNLNNNSELSRVARRWRGAVSDLLTREIAHNDLQHGNVMVQGDSSIRLVDYDGIFLPQYQGQDSPEIGHRNFQHPGRTGQHYATYVDNFPALVIHLTLLALASDPGLWRFNNDDNLILTKADYEDPANSECFRALKGNPDPSVRHLAGELEKYCSLSVDQVPQLEEILNGAPVPSAATTPPASAPPAAAPGQSPAASPGAGASQQAAGGASDYLRLLRMGQSGQMSSGVMPSQPAAPPPAPVPPPSSAPPPVTAPHMTCPDCSRVNPVELIYCDYEGCATILYPGRQPCAQCGDSIPVNANYCPECGIAIV